MLRSTHISPTKWKFEAAPFMLLNTEQIYYILRIFNEAISLSQIPESNAI
jgi:hypothetical protein